MELIPAEFLLNGPISAKNLESVKERLEVELPGDYIEFLKGADGGEGFIGEHYLILWRAEELEPFNKDYQVDEYAPGIFLFGSSGGGEAFGFDTRSDPHSVVQVPFVGMDVKHAHRVAESFYGLLGKMGSSDEPLF